MGISRDSRHKRRATGGKRKSMKKKRQYERGRQPTLTKIGETRVRIVRTRGGHYKARALRLQTGNFSWGSEAMARKSRITGVVYNSTNNELVRTNTLVKGCIVAIDATPFRQWFYSRYGMDLAAEDPLKVPVKTYTPKPKPEKKEGEEPNAPAVGKITLKRKERAIRKAAKLKAAKAKEQTGSKQKTDADAKAPATDKPAEGAAKTQAPKKKPAPAKKRTAPKAEKKQKPPAKKAKKEGDTTEAAKKPDDKKTTDKKTSDKKTDTKTAATKPGDKTGDKKTDVKKPSDKKKAGSKEKKVIVPVYQNVLTKRQSLRKNAPPVDPGLLEQFRSGKLYAAIASQPGQVGRADGYILEGEELAFYVRKLVVKKRK